MDNTLLDRIESSETLRPLKKNRWLVWATLMLVAISLVGTISLQGQTPDSVSITDVIILAVFVFASLLGTVAIAVMIIYGYFTSFKKAPKT